MLMSTQPHSGTIGAVIFCTIHPNYDIAQLLKDEDPALMKYIDKYRKENSLQPWVPTPPYKLRLNRRKPRR